MKPKIHKQVYKGLAPRYGISYVRARNGQHIVIEFNQTQYIFAWPKGKG